MGIASGGAAAPAKDSDVGNDGASDDVGKGGGGMSSGSKHGGGDDGTNISSNSRGRIHYIDGGDGNNGNGLPVNSEHVPAWDGPFSALVQQKESTATASSSKNPPSDSSGGGGDELEPPPLP